MILDFHTHVLPPDFQRHRQLLLETDATFGTLLADPKARLATVEELVETMETQGIDMAVLHGFGWCDTTIAREANDYIIDGMQRFPEKLVGFCSVNPAWGEIAIEEIERCARQGVRGIGELHPDTQGFDLTNQAIMDPIMRTVQDRGLIVLTHSSEPVGHTYPGKGHTTPEKLYQFVKRFPKFPIVCAHWGGGLPFYALMPEVASATTNVYFDTSASSLLYDPEVYPTAIRLVGADHILFGSDYPLLEPQRLLKQVEETVESPEDQKRILGGNATQLLALQKAT